MNKANDLENTLKTKTALLALASVTVGLTACASHPTNPPSPPKIGMANPASTYCVEKGGKLSIRKAPDGGEIGYCTLPSGQEIEEWEFFRNAQK